MDLVQYYGHHWLITDYMECSISSSKPVAEKYIRLSNINLAFCSASPSNLLSSREAVSSNLDWMLDRFTLAGGGLTIRGILEAASLSILNE